MISFYDWLLCYAFVFISYCFGWFDFIRLLERSWDAGFKDFGAKKVYDFTVFFPSNYGKSCQDLGSMVIPLLILIWIFAHYCRSRLRSISPVRSVSIFLAHYFIYSFIKRRVKNIKRMWIAYDNGHANLMLVSSFYNWTWWCSLCSLIMGLFTDRYQDPEAYPVSFDLQYDTFLLIVMILIVVFSFRTTNLSSILVLISCMHR